MKKIYLALPMLLLAGASFGQVNFGPHKASSIVDVRGAETMARPHNTEIGAAERGTPVWSDNFSTPGNWMMTTGAGHTPVGSSNPGWQILTAVPGTLVAQGAYSTLASTSGGNFAFIDSDAPGNSATQDADMTWNGTAIDLSGAGTNFLSLEWQQIHRMFYDIHTVSISVDGGSTWTDFEVNVAYGADVNNYLAHQGIPNPEIISLPVGGVFDPFVSGGGTLNNVSINFNYQGAWDWYWGVDDVAFVPTPANEMNQLYGRHSAATPDPIWGDRLPYNVVSGEQIDPSGYVFFNAAANQGSVTQNGVTLDAEVFNGAASVYTGTGSGVNNVAPLDTARDTTTTAFMPNNTTYVTYDVEINLDYGNLATDNDLSNNMAMSTLQVTDKIYGRAVADYVGSGTYNGVDGGGLANPGISATMITCYANQNLEGIRVVLQGNTDANAVIYPYIVEMDPAATDFQGLFANVLYDGSQIANGSYTVQASDISSTGNTVNLDIPLQSAIPLTAGTAYVIGIGYLGGELAVIGTNAPYAPDATNFVYDAVGANNGNIQWFWIGSTPQIYAMFQVGLGVDEVASGVEMSQNMPNPANGVTSFNYTLKSSAQSVNVEVVDVAGKLVMNLNEGSRGAGMYTVNMNTADLSEGVYFYSLIVDGNKVTKRMVVNK
jgi:hypothetical protein